MWGDTVQITILSCRLMVLKRLEEALRDCMFIMTAAVSY